MSLYKVKQPLVEAFQWFEGYAHPRLYKFAQSSTIIREEDPFITVPHVWNYAWNWDKEMRQDPKYWDDLHSGDWIVEYESGNYRVLSDDTFRATYKKYR